LGYRVQIDDPDEGGLLATNLNSDADLTQRRDSIGSIAGNMGLRLLSMASGSSMDSEAAPPPPGGPILEKVPPMRLRRLFPEGCPVEVYRGAERGWVPAIVVHPRVSEDRYPEPLSAFSPGHGRAQDDRKMHPWVMVDIAEDTDDDKMGLSGAVPSYLLRLRTLYVVSTQNAQDRLLLF